MIEFKKYSPIENSFSREFMEHVVAEMPQVHMRQAYIMG